MKKAFLFLLLIAGFGAAAQQKQSLKDLLYGGKLKLDSTAVIRKSDDLNTKIDTAAKKPVEAEKPKIAAAPDGAATPVTAAADSTAADAIGTVAANANAVAAPAKSNTKILKEATDSLISTLKIEVLPSKKIKKDTYYLMLEYEIGTDGAMNVLNVVSTPVNEFLQQQVKDRLLYSAPRLQPALDSNGQPRKVKRKLNLNITKE